jgi:ankyrin repeat protein
MKHTHSFALVVIASLLAALVTSPSWHSAVAQTTGRSNQFAARLMTAARSNDVDSVKQALREGAAVDSRDESGRTALLIATHGNAIDAARTLIAAGADVNAKDNLEDSPYLYAGAEGRLDILKMTVAAGADLKSVNRYGGTALIPAAHHGHVETVRYLLTTEIDIDHVNYLGWTALLEAVILGDGSPTYQEIVRALLQAGADKTIGDKQGRLPIAHARSRGHSEIVSLLLNVKPRRQRR